MNEDGVGLNEDGIGFDDGVGLNEDGVTSNVYEDGVVLDDGVGLNEDGVTLNVYEDGVVLDEDGDGDTPIGTISNDSNPAFVLLKNNAANNMMKSNAIMICIFIYKSYLFYLFLTLRRVSVSVPHNT